MTPPPITPEAAAAAAAEDGRRIKRALTEASGSVIAAAVALEVSPRTLHRRIAALGLRAWLTDTYPRSKRQPRPDRR
jgi:transcriptional regulator with GAF, ATPase, and Fis domain